MTASENRSPLPRWRRWVNLPVGKYGQRFMIFANIALSGYVILAALVALVSLPITFLAAYGVIEAFLIGNRSSRLASCIWLAVISSILAIAARVLWPFLALDKDTSIMVSLVLLVPLFLGALGALGVAYAIRRRRER